MYRVWALGNEFVSSGSSGTAHELVAEGPGTHTQLCTWVCIHEYMYICIYVCVCRERERKRERKREREKERERRFRVCARAPHQGPQAPLSLFLSPPPPTHTHKQTYQARQCGNDSNVAAKDVQQICARASPEAQAPR